MAISGKGKRPKDSVEAGGRAWDLWWRTKYRLLDVVQRMHERGGGCTFIDEKNLQEWGSDGDG